jgi:hypothetical protein
MVGFQHQQVSQRIASRLGLKFGEKMTHGGSSPLDLGDFCDVSDETERVLVGSNNSITVWDWRTGTCLLSIQMGMDALSSFHTVKWSNSVVAALTTSGIYVWPIVERTATSGGGGSVVTTPRRHSGSNGSGTSSPMRLNSSTGSATDSNNNNNNNNDDNDSPVARWPDPITPASTCDRCWCLFIY